MSELLCCPFCGDTPKGVNFQRKYDFDFAVECQCGACLSQCQYAGGPGQESEERTIAQWNTRAPSPSVLVVTDGVLAAAHNAYDNEADRSATGFCNITCLRAALSAALAAAPRHMTTDERFQLAESATLADLQAERQCVTALRDTCAELREQLEQAKDQLATAHAENEEQARLLGAGGSREVRLMAERDGIRKMYRESLAVVGELGSRDRWRCDEMNKLRAERDAAVGQRDALVEAMEEILAKCQPTVDAAAKGSWVTADTLACATIARQAIDKARGGE